MCHRHVYESVNHVLDRVRFIRLQVGVTLLVASSDIDSVDNCGRFQAFGFPLKSLSPRPRKEAILPSGLVRYYREVFL